MGAVSHGCEKRSEAIAERQKIDWELKVAERKIETLKDKPRDLEPEEVVE